MPERKLPTQPDRIRQPIIRARRVDVTVRRIGEGVRVPILKRQGSITPRLDIPTMHKERGHRLAQPPRPFTKASCPTCGTKAVNPYCPTCAIR